MSKAFMNFNFNKTIYLEEVKYGITMAGYEDFKAN